MYVGRSTRSEGTGVLRPVTGSLCHVKIHCDEASFKELGFEDISNNDISKITLGEWNVFGDGVIHTAVQNMVEGEVCQLHIPIEQLCMVPSGIHVLEYNEKNLKNSGKIHNLEVTLCSYTKGKELWELSLKERYHYALDHKSQGTNLFKRNEKYGSFRRFSLAAKYLISIGPVEDIPEELQSNLKILSSQVLLNLAACQLQLENYEAVVANCSKALEHDENNVKGYFRRAQSLFKLKDFDSAKRDLLKAQTLEPSNAAVVMLLKEVESHMKSANAQMANAMQKMFSL